MKAKGYTYTYIESWVNITLQLLEMKNVNNYSFYGNSTIFCTNFYQRALQFWGLLGLCLVPYLLSGALSFSLDCSKYRRKGKKGRNGTVWKAHWDFLPNFLSLQYYSTHKCVLGIQRCTFLFYYSINHFKFSQKKLTIFHFWAWL